MLALFTEVNDRDLNIYASTAKLPPAKKQFCTSITKRASLEPLSSVYRNTDPFIKLGCVIAVYVRQNSKNEFYVVF